MARNKLSDLRDHLFETIEALKDKDDPLDLGRAKTISDVAGKIIDTARVEVQFYKTAGELLGQETRIETEFFGPSHKALPPAPDQPAHKPNGKAGS